MVAKNVQEVMTEAPQDSPTGQFIRTSIEGKIGTGIGRQTF
jgi:hypothetical protein